ncbi:MAG: bacillithiol biosynthesis cysteine-adding enzyme BshC [bacterium]
MVIPTKQMPNISSLVYDYFYCYPKVGKYYNGNFRDLDAFKQQTEKIKSRHLFREQLAAILKVQNQDYGCGRKTLGNINKLIQDQTCAVVTGQQVGLFSGPLYTIYKSLTVIKLSEYLNQNANGCYVPIFWLASDDHDFAEINHIKLLNRDNRVEEIRYKSHSSNLKIPASKILFTSEILNCFQLLKDFTQDSEFKQEIIFHLSEAYKPGRSFSEAFAKWMTQLFKPYGLIFIDASHHDLKYLGKRVFFHEISEDSPSTRQAMEASKKLTQDKYKSQIQLHEGRLNLFFAEKERLTIQFKDKNYSIKGTQKTYKRAELLALLEKKPHIFSPNVLLRPIYQDNLLPTVAYVGGPGEIAYLAQMKGVYENFGLSMPIIYPRKSITILEKKIGEVLKNYDLKIQDMWQNVERVITKISKKQIPDSVDRALSTATSHLEKDLQMIKQEIMAFEPSLEKSVEVTLGKIKQKYKFLEKKILQASKKRDSIVTKQIHKATNNLYPNNRLQERVLNIAPFLIKYSHAFIDKLYKAIDIDNHDHQVIKL